MLTHSLIRTTHQTKSVRAVNRNRCHGAGNGTNTHIHTHRRKERSHQTTTKYREPRGKYTKFTKAGTKTRTQQQPNIPPLNYIIRQVNKRNEN